MAKRKEIEMIKSHGIMEKERVALEAQELLDEPEKTDYEKKRSSGFFKNIFSKKEKSSKIEDSESFVEDQEKDILKFTTSTSSTSVQKKDAVKSDSVTPGRTKPVPKYRWQH